MSLREISAWLMAAVMIATGVSYLDAYHMAATTIGGAVPSFDIFLPYATLVVTASIVVQVALAVFSPSQRDQPPDERERPLLWRAGHIAGLLHGGLVVGALLYVTHSGNTALLFHLIVAGLIVSQTAEYVLQIFFLRRAG